MKYQKASELIPENLILAIQEYVDGVFIYIPRRHGKKMAWGTKSGIKSSLNQRNDEIYFKFRKGKTNGELADEYFLSQHSIRRIISQEKRKHSFPGEK
jgi:Mor family transcriptional regulator